MAATLVAIYSPVCEAGMAFVGLLREWAGEAGAGVVALAYDPGDAAQMRLYRENDMPRDTRFIDVFLDGRLVDSVPLDRGVIRAALGLAAEGETARAGMAEARAVDMGRVEWVPITRETVAEEMGMCLYNYPYGNPPGRFHRACRESKARVFAEVWEREACAGVYARLEGQVVGLLEVLPREVLRRHGFLTGETGMDGDWLTVGCYEVGAGVARVDMLDGLMRAVLAEAGRFGRRMIEGVGAFERPEGFWPYWVYDKYGFRCKERLGDGRVVMGRGW